MSQHLKAIYEHGVFRPLEPVRLREHQEVTLVLETTEGRGAAAEDKPIWEVAEDLLRDIPEEVLDSVPVDGAAQHDHYLYAAPKRD
jgi:predicted DNA-binding antitoxin AbrB/MazE fold protein